LAAGLPDGLFSNQKIQIWVNFGGSCTGRCWYNFMDTWSILRSFVIFYGHSVYIVSGNLVYFSRFGILFQEKSGNPDWQDEKKSEIPRLAA
jgi:hypothetical protein